MLARALCQQPDVLVLDEPTSFLDVRYKLEFLSVLQEMARKEKLTVMMSLHELDLAERISDKIVCVRGVQWIVLVHLRKFLRAVIYRALWYDCGQL